VSIYLLIISFETNYIYKILVYH